MASVEEQGGQASTRDGSFSRLVGAVVSPRETFDSIARKPSWVLPVFLIIVVNLIVAFGLFHRGTMRAAMEKQFDASPMYAQLSPQQRKQNIDMALRFAPVAAYARAVLATPIVLAIVALILLGAFNIVFSTKIGFGQAFGIAAFAFVPILLRDFLSLGMVWGRPPGDANLKSLSMSSLNAYLPAHSPVWLASLGGHLDVFTFWTIGLMAVGFAAASSKKVRFGSALAVVVVLWLIYVLGSVGLSASLASMIPKP